MKRVEVGDTPVKIVPVKSKRFLCAKCLDFLIELTPVLKPGMGKDYYERKRQGKKIAPMRVRLRCPRGCHRTMGWTFYDSSQAMSKKGTPSRFRPMAGNEQ